MTVRFVDGGVQDFVRGEDFVQRLRALQAQGFEGKSLIHELLTDDWGPPPVGVHVRTDALDLWIPYA